MSNKDFWKSSDDIKKAAKAYAQKDYETALHLIFENEPNEEIFFMDTGDIAESQMDIMVHALNKKHADRTGDASFNGN